MSFLVYTLHAQKAPLGLGQSGPSIKTHPAAGSLIHFSCLLLLGEQGELQAPSPHLPLSLLLLAFWPRPSLCLRVALGVGLVLDAAPSTTVLLATVGGDGRRFSAVFAGALGPLFFLEHPVPAPSLCLLSWPAGCQAAADTLRVLSLPSLPGAPPSRSHVLLRSVPSLWPNPACQQLQRALCPAVPGLPCGDPALSCGGDPARPHSQLLPPEHRCGIFSICCRWQHPERGGSAHLLWRLWPLWLWWPLLWQKVPALLKARRTTSERINQEARSKLPD